MLHGHHNNAKQPDTKEEPRPSKAHLFSLALNLSYYTDPYIAYCWDSYLEPLLQAEQEDSNIAGADELPLPYDTYEPPDTLSIQLSAKPMLDKFVEFHSQPLNLMISFYLEGDVTWLSKIKTRIERINYYLQEKSSLYYQNKLLPPTDLISDIAFIASEIQRLTSLPKLTTREKILFAILARNKSTSLLHMAEQEGEILAIPLLMELDKPRNNLSSAEAKKYFEKLLSASKQKEVDASIFYCLATNYEFPTWTNLKIKESKLLARNYLQEGAEKNHADSFCRLGCLYIFRKNALFNPDKAVSYFQRAAMQGNREAIYRIVDMWASAELDRKAVAAECFRFYLEIISHQSDGAFWQAYDHFKHSWNPTNSKPNIGVIFHMALVLEFQTTKNLPKKLIDPKDEKILSEKFNSLIMNQDKEMATLLYDNIDLYPRIKNLLDEKTLQQIEAWKIQQRTVISADDKLIVDKRNMSLQHNWIARLLLRETYKIGTLANTSSNDAKSTAPFFQQNTATLASTATAAAGTSPSLTANKK